MASTRDTIGERETFERLISRTIDGTFEEDSAITLCKGALKGTDTTHIILPNVTLIDAECLMESKVRTIDFGSNVSVPSDYSYVSIAKYSKLESMILRYPRVVDMLSRTSYYNRYVFQETRIELGEGSLFVPDDLVDAYDESINGYGLTPVTRGARLLGKTYVQVNPISAYPMSDYSTISGSWADIVATANAGTHADRFVVGDTKLLELTDGTRLYMQIVAMDTDTLASDGTSKAALSWMCSGICPYQRSVDSDAALWPDTELHEWLESELFQLLPIAVRRGIKRVRKYYSYGSADDAMSYGQSDDLVWIPSRQEIDYSSNSGSPEAGYSGVYQLRRDPDFMDGGIWTRDSSSTGDKYYVKGVYTGSHSSVYGGTSGAYNSHLIVFGFCM